MVGVLLGVGVMVGVGVGVRKMISAMRPRHYRVAHRQTDGAIY